jgi:transcriptional regulator with XRE-family HTH domain
MRSARNYPTRFDAWLAANAIRPLALARRSGVSRQTISRLRRGLSSGAPMTREKILTACKRMIGRPVQEEELFGGEAGAAAEISNSWTRSK